MDVNDERFENLSEDVKAEAMACKTPEELHDLAAKQGLELSIEELDGVSGGWCSSNECQSDDKPC